jgi:hypothetical protein
VNCGLVYAYFSKIGLYDPYAVCAPMKISPSPFKFLVPETRYESRYVHHNTRVHFNGILLKSLQSLCICVHYQSHQKLHQQPLETTQQ